MNLTFKILFASCLLIFGIPSYQSTVHAQDEWLEKFERLTDAAEKGDSDSQFLLGMEYHKMTPAHDFEEAAKWFLRASEQGHADAQYYLGTSYETGWGVTRDYKKMEEDLLLAAEQGHSEAQFRLALAYYMGDRLTQRYSEAMRLFLPLANRGNSDAQLFVGYMYMDGAVGAPNYELAEMMFRASAEAGDSSAQFALGTLYLSADSPLHDMARAYLWLDLSATQGLDEAETLRRQIEGSMNAEDISRAKSLAEKCRISGYRQCE